MSCHCTYGKAVQELLGAFTFGLDGMTDLEADLDGHPISIDRGAATIVALFMDAAFSTNRTI